MSVINISDALFTKTQQRVLALLYGNPEQSFYTNEIVRRADMGRGTVTRELEKLVSAGGLVMTRMGNQHHYQANNACPIYKELIEIVKKTFGVVGVIKNALTELDDQFDCAFIYGSIAKREETAASDVDLFIVTESLAYADVMNLLISAEEALGRTINPSMYTKNQIKNKLTESNAFLIRLMEQPKLWIKGTEDDIRAFR